MEVNIHMDPLCTDIHKINEVRHVLDKIVHERYPAITHDHLRITAGHARLNIICDIHVPPEEYNVENIARIRRDINDCMRKIQTINTASSWPKSWLIRGNDKRACRTCDKPF